MILIGGSPEIGGQISNLRLQYSVHFERFGLLEPVMSSVDRLDECDVRGWFG
jgi:hypothetical protein